MRTCSSLRNRRQESHAEASWVLPYRFLYFNCEDRIIRRKAFTEHRSTFTEQNKMRDRLVRRLATTVSSEAEDQDTPSPQNNAVDIVLPPLPLNDLEKCLVHLVKLLPNPIKPCRPQSPL